MFKVIYYKGKSMKRDIVASRDDAFCYAIDNDICGVQIINRPVSESPSSYMYYIIDGDIKAVNKSQFMRRVK